MRKFLRRHIDFPDFGLTPVGKRFLCIFAGLLMSLIGFLAGWIIFSLFGMILSTAALLNFWIMRVPTECPGPKSIFTSPSGEMEIGLCYGCNSWRLDVRGETKGHDRGHESLIARLRDLASSHSKNLPHLAAEMRVIADHVEAMESLGDPDTPPVPSERVVTPEQEIEKMQTQIETAIAEGTDALDAVQEVILAGLPEGMDAHISVPVNEFLEFMRWQKSQPDQEEQDVRTDEEPPGD